VYDHIIIVRATNAASIPYIGRNKFTPKPIDCKPKTADKNAFLAGSGIQVECAGLVIDPTLLPNSLNCKKLPEANECWRKFTEGHNGAELHDRVFRRKSSAGFYAVDTYKSSDKYGCLMLSKINAPSTDFKLSVPTWQTFKRQSMSYVHGDYDLYGLIDVQEVLKNYTASGGRDLVVKEVFTQMLHGVSNFHTKKFGEIQTFLNSGIGVPMIQHGSQDTFEHKDDKLYVFNPVGGVYCLEETADTIREVYRLLFKQDT
jgi:hypothetical protein